MLLCVKRRVLWRNSDATCYLLSQWHDAVGRWVDFYCLWTQPGQLFSPVSSLNAKLTLGAGCSSIQHEWYLSSHLTLVWLSMSLCSSVFCFFPLKWTHKGINHTESVYKKNSSVWEGQRLKSQPHSSFNRPECGTDTAVRLTFFSVFFQLKDSQWGITP